LIRPPFFFQERGLGDGADNPLSLRERAGVREMLK